MGFILQNYAKWVFQDHLVICWTWWTTVFVCCDRFGNLGPEDIAHEKIKQNKTNAEHACSNLVLSRFIVNNSTFEDIER